jgi:ketosteroid isomerase-like protein
MPSENMEAFKRVVEAANRSDTEALVELLHPDVEWHTVLPMVGGDGIYRGIEGVREFLEDIWGVLAETRWEFSEIRDLEDGRILALGQVRITGGASGVEVDSPFAYLIEFRDGKPYLIQSFLDPDKALEAAGPRG